MNNFYVYMLISKRKNIFVSYVGYTNNLKKRLDLHNNSKGAKFTRGNKWTLIYKKIFKTKNRAMREEYLLKHDIKKRTRIKNKFLKYEYINSSTL